MKIHKKFHDNCYNTYIMKILRPRYLEKLKDRMNNSLIKVITGLRRSGKSFLLFTLFKEYLLSLNIDENHIIEIKLDQDDKVYLRDKNKLKKYIYSKIIDKGKYYILLDEIQYVKNFEPVLIELMRIENVDIYVTGSNSKFLSTDIDTSLNGKNDSIHVYPLSFNEFASVYENKTLAWNDFVKYGSLPQTLYYSKNEDKKNYLIKTFAELYLKDVIDRYRIDYPEQLNQITKVLSSSIGSYTNICNISNTIKSINHIELKYETIAKYVKYLENAFILSQCERFELKGRKYIGANKKYYFEDIGIRNCILNFKNGDLSHILENIVYNELIKYGYSVDVGIVPYKEKNTNTNKYENKLLEIDFVANKFEKQYLIQVVKDLSKDNVKYRENKSLIKAKTNSPRLIVVGDINQPSFINEQGIQIYNIFDFFDFLVNE